MRKRQQKPQQLRSIQMILILQRIHGMSLILIILMMVRQLLLVRPKVVRHLLMMKREILEIRLTAIIIQHMYLVQMIKNFLKQDRHGGLCRF